MSDETRVWLTKRKGAKVITRYSLRWLDVSTGRWRCKAAGTDSRLAERLAADLENKLAAGTYRHVTTKDWAGFAADHVSKIENLRYAIDFAYTLREFGEWMKPRSVRAVSFAMVEAYVAMLVRAKTKPGTVNKKIKHLHRAFACAIERGFLSVHPMRKSLLRPVEKRDPRTLTEEEEVRLLDAAERLYGFRWWALLTMMLATGARRSELTDLSWDRVRLDGDDPQVEFVCTKTHVDRSVPLDVEAASVLRRLRAQTMQQPGPFTGMYGTFLQRWGKTIEAAGIKNATGHCLRKTVITRMLRQGTPLHVVSQIAGVGVDIITKVYAAVSNADKQKAIRALRRDVG